MKPGDPIPSGVMKGKPFRSVRTIGEQCDICEGPCRSGTCPRCGGHSEHNVGCDTLGETLR